MKNALTAELDKWKDAHAKMKKQLEALKGMFMVWIDSDFRRGGNHTKATR